FGGLCEELKDYEEIRLPERIDSPTGRELAAIVDPYSYRDRLLQPKLILLATDAPYWPLDALNVYWNGLPEPKRVLYLPNQTHGLRDVDRLIGRLAALNRCAEEGKAMLEVTGAFTRRNGRLESTD